MKKFRLSFIHYVLIGFISFAILAIFLRIFGKGYVTLIAIFLVLAGLIALFEYQLQISELDELEQIQYVNLIYNIAKCTERKNWLTNHCLRCLALLADK